MSLRFAVLIGLLIGHCLGLTLHPVTAAAVSSSSLVVSELQTGGAASGHAADEFIELYNPGETDLLLEHWLIQYRSAGAGSDCNKSWTTKLDLPATAKIKSHGFYLLGTSYLTSADARFASGLPATGGAIRVVDAGGSIVDALAWGTAACGEGKAAAAIVDGQSLERRPGLDAADGGNAVDTDDNSSDFVVRAIPEPQSTTAPTEDPVDSTTAAVADTPTYLPVDITELLVDPVAPATDAHDEYVELHNPNLEPVELTGYVLRTGTKVYHVPTQVLDADAYLVLYSGSATISLANAGGSAQLLDPNGTIVSQTGTWSSAVPGATWAAFDGGWQWTAAPTPAAPNVLVAVASAVPDEATTDDTVYQAISITELLPDPAAPLHDDHDEYIELYNPEDQPVDIAGYNLAAGPSLSSHFVLPAATINPGEYLVIYSAQSHLALANGGSKVAVLGPNGQMMGDAVEYSTAPTGQAWAAFADGWHWTTTVTPGTPNILTAAVKTASTKATKQVATKKTSGTVQGAKTTKAKAVKEKTTAKKTAKPLAAAMAKPVAGHWLLFILAGLTIGYGIYEFRYDLQNYYYRTRRYWQAWRSRRAASTRR